jgi:hypothetical protein
MIYITGDTHGDITDLQKKAKGLTGDDILIIAGDFGFDWDGLTIKTWLQTRKPYTVLFCDGNHENFDILDSLPKEERFGSEVGRFDGRTFRLLSGHMYTIGGLRFFVFGGASSIDRRDRIPGKSWWPEEIPPFRVFKKAEDTLAENGWKFDIFLSHTCNPEVKKKVLGPYAMDFYDPVESMIESLEAGIRTNGGGYREHYFGHLHEDKDFGNEHCLYNRTVCIEEAT